jgi:acyl carrier protein
MEINKFLENFSGILDNTDASLIKGETIFRDLDEWDSLTALSLIAMADEVYSVKLSGDDIRSAVTLNDIYKAIKNK